MRFLASIAVVAAWLVAGQAAADVGAIRPIGDVLDLPIEAVQLEPEVRIRGTITFRSGASLIVQDAGDGIFIDADKAVKRGVRADALLLADAVPGAIVEIDGRAAPGGLTHVILPTTIRLIGSGPLPEPVPFNAERFFSGLEAAKVVQATGVVQAVEERRERCAITIETDMRTLQATVPTAMIREEPVRLIDAVVRVTGVQMGFTNTRGEPVQPQVYVTREAGFEIVRPAASGPFEVKKVPLESLGRYRRQPLFGHRIRTEGMVIHAVPRETVYLQSAANGVLVQTDFAEPLAPGDRVEVSGFIDRTSRVVGLRGAMVRRIASGSPPDPMSITADRIAEIVSQSIASGIMALPGDYDGSLIRIRATLVEKRRGDTEGTLLLSAGKTTVLARIDLDSFSRLDSLQTGSELAVTGIAQATAIRTGFGQARQPIDTIGLLLRSAADVELTKPPPWWSTRRVALTLTGGLGVAAVAALGGFIWVAMLRRRVAAQLAVIEEQLQSEAVAEERRRIAREFHDRLDQGLAGLALRFDAAASQAPDAPTRSLLLGQRRSLASLQSEARDFLWDLRYPTHLEDSFVDSIRQQVVYMRQLTPVSLTVEATGLVPPLPTQVHYHLMRIIREAVSNSIKYAHAGAITVRITGPGEGRRRLTVSVTDDGAGFDVAERSMADGHFGIRGMQERARRIGADLRVESGQGRGTRVAIDLPLADG